MSKDNAVYIGSTPKHLTRVAKEMSMKKNSENNRRLLESLGYNYKSNIPGKIPGGIVTVKKA
ncbi:hypothetical protein [Bacillus sp. REN16]|uniref:hypothetical protein n=1 Tax=Bacillus sp. REN16 TaxID=2887296 RepID=UPI001E36981C|nr:hypothetical protein [Bacillus sp. REN16]MCC3359411.1 hypothetical protein [Bacillus sp. REN16]